MIPSETPCYILPGSDMARRTALPQTVLPGYDVGMIWGMDTAPPPSKGPPECALGMMWV